MKYRGVERRQRTPGRICAGSPDIVTFIDVHRRRLNAAFGLNWRRAPAHTAVRCILQGLDPAAVEGAFRRHAALLQAPRATPGQASVALDGKTLRRSVEPRGSPDFGKFRERAAAQVLSAFATDTVLVLTHIDVEPRGSLETAEKSKESPAAQALLAELGIAQDTLVTLDALHCQKTFRSRRSSQHRPDRGCQEPPANGQGFRIKRQAFG